MRLRMIKLFLCCLFHVKGYSWYSPYVRREMEKDEKRRDHNAKV